MSQRAVQQPIATPAGAAFRSRRWVWVLYALLGATAGMATAHSITGRSDTNDAPLQPQLLPAGTSQLRSPTTRTPPQYVREPRSAALPRPPEAAPEPIAANPVDHSVTGQSATGHSVTGRSDGNPASRSNSSPVNYPLLRSPTTRIAQTLAAPLPSPDSTVVNSTVLNSNVVESIPAGPSLPLRSPTSYAPHSVTAPIMPHGPFASPMAGPMTAPLMPQAPLGVAAGPVRPIDCNTQARPILAIDCGVTGSCVDWRAAQPLNFQPFGQGEYVGHARAPHVNEYRLRVDDLLEFVFRITREEQSQPYRFNVGDEIRVESFTDPTLNRDLIIQPDGTITLRLVGQVRATRHTVSELRDEVEQLYSRYYKTPAVTVTPLKVNTKLEDLRAAVDRRQGSGGQTREARVTPEGTVALPAIGSVFAQGLTLDELKREIDARYAAEVEGLEVTPVLVHRAPRYVFVLGEVRLPGRFTLEGPTTVMQSIALAGGWNIGGNLRQVVVFRRGDDWRLMATMLDIRGALYGKVPCPADEIWLNDADIVVVPKSPIRVFDDYVRLIFTEGLYHIAPFSTNVNFSFLNTLTNAGAVAGS